MQVEQHFGLIPLYVHCAVYWSYNLSVIEFIFKPKGFPASIVQRASRRRHTWNFTRPDCTVSGRHDLYKKVFQLTENFEGGGNVHSCPECGSRWKPFIHLLNLLLRFGLASDLTEHKRQSTCGGSRHVIYYWWLMMRTRKHNKAIAGGNATNAAEVWEAREVLKSMLEFTQGAMINE